MWGSAGHTSFLSGTWWRYNLKTHQPWHLISRFGHMIVDNTPHLSHEAEERYNPPRWHGILYCFLLVSVSAKD